MVRADEAGASGEQATGEVGQVSASARHDSHALPGDGVHLIGGVIVTLVGIGVFSRAEWARVLGIVVAVLWIIVRVPLIFTFPIVALVGIVLAVLVIYGLAVYGDRDTA